MTLTHEFLLSLKSMKTTSVADTAIISATERGVPQSVISLPAVLSEQADATSMKDQHLVSPVKHLEKPNPGGN